MKVEHEMKLDRIEIIMIRWIRGFTLKERKKITDPIYYVNCNFFAHRLTYIVLSVKYSA